VTTTEQMRKKYAKRKRSNGVSSYPPGGQDVALLCEQLDYATKAMRAIHSLADSETQKRIDRALCIIEGDWI